MDFKSAKDMKLKANKNKRLMTLEQSKWINDLKIKIKNELDKAYNEKPHVGFVSIYMNISRGIIIDVDTKEYAYQIKDIEDDLKRLGYIVNTEFLYDNFGDADCYYMNIEWNVK